MDEERLAHRFAEAIYGTVVAAGVLVAVSDESQPDAGAAAAYALVTVVVLWLAHAWAHTLGRRAAGAATLGGFTGSLVADSPLVLAALPALAGLGLALCSGRATRRPWTWRAGSASLCLRPGVARSACASAKVRCASP